MSPSASEGSGEMSTQRRVKRSRFSEAPVAPVEYSSASSGIPYHHSEQAHGSLPHYQSYELSRTAEVSSTSTASTEGSPCSTLPIVAKRKMGGRVLKTGVLTADKKQKTEDSSASKTSNNSSAKSAPGSAYLEEMKKYSEQLCAEERHARPLVK